MKICYACHQNVEETEMRSGLHPTCFCNWFDVAQPGEFRDVVRRSTEQVSGKGAEWIKINTSFFHGKFRKYSASIGSHGYILKVVQYDIPALPATEYLCNQIARVLKLEIPDFYMILFQNQLETFVSKNFMHERQGSDLVHIYRYLDKPEHYDCEHLLKIIEREVDQYDAVVRFIELCLFDALIGNHDRHGRNLGLIREAHQTLLAPFYDNPCYLATEIPELLGAYHEPRGAIATLQSKEPIMTDYVKEWYRLGFKEEVVQFAKRVDMQTIEDLVSASFLTEKRKKAIFNLIQRRYLELCHAI